MIVLALLYLGYGLCFWGTTLLAGGPDQTGSWPLMYTLFAVGRKPVAVARSGQSTGTAAGPETRWAAGP